MQEDIYVDFILKSAVKKDKDGNYLFEVEASNENLDLDNQRVQQKALLDSKDYFLSNGVISDDHLHHYKDENGKYHDDKTKIIGEPIDIYTKGMRTFVRGKLYSNVEAAQPYIKMLKAHSTRVKASVGGFNAIVQKNSNGSQTVKAFHWNDLALTCSPVNYTVGSARFAKSMTAKEFCKSLQATSESGEALQKEDVEKGTVNVTNNAGADNGEKEQEAVEELLNLAKNERINGKDDAVEFLMSKGIEKEKAETLVSEIINHRGTMMKKSFSEKVNDILKSITGNNNDDKPPAKDGAETDDNTSISDDGDDEGADNDDGDDGEVVIKALSAELKELKKSIKALNKQNVDLGNSLVGVATIVKSIADAETPMRSTVNKSIGGGRGNKDNRPSATEFDLVKDILAKSVRDGEISVFESTAIEGEVQKAMRLGTPMSDRAYNFIASRMPEKKGGKN